LFLILFCPFALHRPLPRFLRFRFNFHRQQTLRETQTTTKKKRTKIHEQTTKQNNENKQTETKKSHLTAIQGTKVNKREQKRETINLYSLSLSLSLSLLLSAS